MRSSTPRPPPVTGLRASLRPRRTVKWAASSRSDAWECTKASGATGGLSTSGFFDTGCSTRRRRWPREAPVLALGGPGRVHVLRLSACTLDVLEAASTPRPPSRVLSIRLDHHRGEAWSPPDHAHTPTPPPPPP